MSEITTVGLDLAKRVVSLCGEDAAGRVCCSARCGTDCQEPRYDDGHTDAARTWLTCRPDHEAADRLRAQRAVSSMARVATDHSTRPDTELQSDPSSPQSHLHFRGSPYSRAQRTTLNWWLSAFDSDNVRLNLAVDRTRPEPLGDSFRCHVGCFAKSGLVARLDLVS